MRPRVLLIALLVATGPSFVVAAEPACPATKPGPRRLPGVTAAHETLAYWLDAVGRRHDLDAVLLTPAEIARHTATGERRPSDPLSQRRALATFDAHLMRTRATTMLAHVGERVARGEYVDWDGRPLDRSYRGVFVSPVFRAAPTLHVAVADAQLYCGPVARPLRRAPLAAAPVDVNACSMVRAQEPVQVLADWPGGMRLARTRYALGWLAADAPLSPPVPPALVAAVVDGPRVLAATRLVLDRPAGPRVVGPHTLLPLAPGADDRVLVATRAGFADAARAAELVAVRRPLTRRAFLATAFAFLGEPYGYGGAGGGRDCSELVLDAFEAFDLELPRHSAAQVRAGTLRIPVPETAGETGRLALLDAADARGIVLLALPGHVAIYLGRDAQGVPMVLQALDGFAEPCPAGRGETRVVVRRVVVSRLDVGRGSSSGSLLARTSALAVFGSN